MKSMTQDFRDGTLDQELASRMGEHNRQKAEREYAYELVVQLWVTLYIRVSAGL